MYCSNCGAELKENARFCIRCGNPVKGLNNSGKKKISLKKEPLHKEASTVAPMPQPVKQKAPLPKEPIQKAPVQNESVPKRPIQSAPTQKDKIPASPVIIASNSQALHKKTDIKLLIGLILAVLAVICSIIAILSFFNTLSTDLASEDNRIDAINEEYSDNDSSITGSDDITGSVAEEYTHVNELTESEDNANTILNDVATDVQDIQNYIDLIDGMRNMTDSGIYDGVGPNNYRRTYYDDGTFQDELIKTEINTGTEDVDKLMHTYGYKDYTLIYYYDNYDYCNDVISYGPNLIDATIDGRHFKYYFYMNNMIRRVAPDAVSDSPKTNDFLKGLYSKGFEYKRTYDSISQSSDTSSETNSEPVLFSVVVSAPDGYVNFRTGPGTDYKIITPISNGITLDVYEENADGKWFRVEYENKSGWIAKSQVTIR